MSFVHSPLVITLVLLTGCTSENHMKGPLIIKEARLPAGFPPPGPVGKIIVKKYPADRRALVRGGDVGVDGDSSAMFRPLYNHIKRNNISMTAPVEMGFPENGESDKGASSMAFLYGKPSWGALGPDAEDQRVVVVDVPAMTVVSIGIRGRYTNANFKSALGKLNEWVAQNDPRVRVRGEPRYLGYNSPFVLGFLRYGEVQLPVVFNERANERVSP